MKQSISVIKIGGQLIQESEQLDWVLEAFCKINGPKVLVHGGGRRANELLKALDIEPLMLNGRRITDEATLEIVTMVYAGLVNKNIVALLQAKGCNALGLSGADGNLIRAHKRQGASADYGFARDIDEVNSSFLISLLDQGISPVCCAITHDQKGQLLNTNADTIASTIAQALAKNQKVSLKFCFEKSGVCLDPDDERSLIEELAFSKYKDLIAEGVITDGMIPKLDMAFEALRQNVGEVWICGKEGLGENGGTLKTNLVLD